MACFSDHAYTGTKQRQTLQYYNQLQLCQLGVCVNYFKLCLLLQGLHFHPLMFLTNLQQVLQDAHSLLG